MNVLHVQWGKYKNFEHCKLEKMRRSYLSNITGTAL